MDSETPRKGGRGPESVPRMDASSPLRSEGLRWAVAEVVVGALSAESARGGLSLADRRSAR
jgi:hypothetical protein